MCIYVSQRGLRSTKHHLFDLSPSTCALDPASAPYTTILHTDLSTIMSPSVDDTEANAILPRRQVTYCGPCGMPLEYCEYGPDYETHCVPWWKKNHPEMFAAYIEKSGKSVESGQGVAAATTTSKPPKPDRPWTTEERLTAFYEKYVPEKVETVPSLLEKYAGKEENLFNALVKKYGPEPNDPYYSESEDENEDDEEEESGDEEDAGDDIAGASKKHRRGVSAKKSKTVVTKVVIKKVAQKKKRNLTVVSGMDTIPNIKLKDAAKAFSKKFAGSSSVKKNAMGQEEIIIQGDHVYDVAEMIVEKFGVHEQDLSILPDP